jgi:hypothetical protein
MAKREAISMLRGVAISILTVLITVGILFSADAAVVGAWLFDEDDGDEAVDSSGRGIDGVLVGSPERMAGQFGGALKFEPSKYVDFPPPLSEMMILERDKQLSGCNIHAGGFIKWRNLWLLLRYWR